MGLNIWSIAGGMVLGPLGGGSQLEEVGYWSSGLEVLTGPISCLISTANPCNNYVPIFHHLEP